MLTLPKSLLPFLFAFISTVVFAQQPANDNFANAQNIDALLNGCSTDAAFTLLNATPDGSAASCWGGATNRNVWFSFTAPDSGAIEITLERGGTKGTLDYAKMALWDNTGAGELACNIYTNPTDNIVLTYDSLIGGQVYYVSVDSDSVSGTENTFSLCANFYDYDYYEGAIDVTSIINSCSTDAEYTTVGATADRNPGSTWGSNGSMHNRWFRFQAPATGEINITIDIGSGKGTQTMSQVALWEADGVTEVHSEKYPSVNSDVVMGAVGLVPSNTYYISVGPNYDNVGTFTLCLEDTVDYDFYEGAIDITSFINGCSPDEAYTTVGATADRNPGSTWGSNGVMRNRWFLFTAPTSGEIKITADIQDGKGTQTMTQMAIWEVDGITEVNSVKYVSTTDDVILQSPNLIPGNTYYMSVAPNYSSVGSFTLCLEDAVDYDFYEGAIDISNLINSCSADAEYTTVNATPDRNPGSAWGIGPFYNRWFSFVATSNNVQVSIDRGDEKGTQRGTMLALWENDGTTELSSARFSNLDDDVMLSHSGLTVGNTYYISVDARYASNKGTFTICLDTDTDGDGVLDETDLDDDNDGILDSVEIAACDNLLRYEFYDLVPSGYTVDNIPTSNPMAKGGINSFDVNALQESIDPGDQDQFSIRYKGYISITTAGLYTFYTSSDDGSKLYIDGVEIVNNDGAHSTQEQSGTINLVVGDYPIEILFFENGGGANLQVEYAGPSISKQPIPFSNLKMPCDIDDDGLKNHLDLDSDNDGIPDNVEAQSTLGYIAPNADNASTYAANNGVNSAYIGGLTIINTDGTDLPDFMDSDSDNDGLLDANEANITLTNTDDDYDGLDNATDATMGYADPGGTVDNPLDAPVILPDVDADASTVGDVDYRDNYFHIDTDGDGVHDIIDLDDDNDGIYDSVELAACNGAMAYEFYDLVPDGDSVDAIPTTGALGTGSINTFDVDILQNNVDPGDTDSFAIRYTGYITINTSEVYTFYTRSDDGSKLYIDGVEIVDNDGRHGAQERSGTVNLTQGVHEITVLFFEYGGGEELTVQYSSGSIAKQAIPFSVLNDGSCDADGDGLSNHLDQDADGDGIPDHVEAQETATYIAPAGSVNANGVDTNYPGGLTPVNTDGADEPDFLDLDSDNEGDIDTVEANIVLANSDADNDGLDDAIDNTTGYSDPGGIIDDPLASPIALPDVDSDALSGGDVDFRDATDDRPDSDNDGIIDEVDNDDDNDGVLDIYEQDCFGDAPQNLVEPTVVNGGSVVTAMYTDFNGYWFSSSSARNGVRPNLAHNIIAFETGGVTYTTGVANSRLFDTTLDGRYNVIDTDGDATGDLAATGLDWQGFYPTTTITGKLVLESSANDGNASSALGTTVMPTASGSQNAALTHGERGLDIGSGVANVNGTWFYNMSSIVASSIGDGIPDILVNQIADPSGGISQTFAFFDSAGNPVGNAVRVTAPSGGLSTVLGSQLFDIYHPNDAIFASNSPRDIRLATLELSEFGIDASNAGDVVLLRMQLSSNSDSAFIAYNTDSFSNNCNDKDTDGDGIVDRLDTDSDGDGCSDADEAYGDASIDEDNNGMYGTGNPAVQTDGTVTAASYIVPVDADNNGTYDYLEAGTAVTITTQPSDISTCEEGDVSFTVAATNASTYQWQTYDGSDWIDVSNGGIYSGATSNTLQISNIPLSENANRYRVVVDVDGFVCGTAISDEVTLTVNELPDITIGDADAIEGNAITFPITLSAASCDNADITLTFSFTNGTAGDADYTNTDIQITIPAGDTTASVVVPTTDDTIFEADEDFTISIASVDAGTVSDSSDTATGTINNDDTAPVITITDADATEGTAITFPVALNVASSEDITLTFSFTNGTAGDADYTNTDIQITIPAGDTTASVVVPTTDDTIFEADEDFTISIASVDAGTVSDSSDTATGTINNDDTAPVITITDADATEGTAITFPVALDVASSEDITLTFSFTNGTAGDADYTNTDIQITIPAGDTTASVVVPTTDDTIFEADEDFTISIASVDAGTVGDTSDTATGTINNDDTAPVITITDADATEGTAISFPVALDVASSEDITLTFSFTNGTAGDADYTNTDIQITIPAGDTTASVVVPTTDDTIFEADEDFTISIASVDAGTVSDTSDTATGTINNDDTAPVITITDADATEGTAITFPVALDVASSEDITLTFSFTNGTAGDADYTNTDIQITIPAGDTTASVVVPTTDDTIFEADEDFTISIASVDAGTVGDTSDTATGTITNDDTAPVITITDADATEGTAISFLVALDVASSEDITLTFSFTNGTAGDTDYTNTDIQITIPAGDTTASVVVPTTDDTIFEADEDFTISIASVDAGTVSDTSDTATGTINNDDTAPVITITDADATEGTAITFPVALNVASSEDITLTFSFTNGTAGDTDYTNTDIQITIPAGDTTASVVVPTTDDTIFEADEDFTISIASVDAGTVSDTSDTATGTINNDDTAPVITITDADATEGTAISFPVALDAASSEDITLTFSFTNGTAVDADYTNTDIQITIPAGDTTASVVVPTTDDTIFEADEDFTISIASVDAGTVSDTSDTATGTITNDDTAPVITITDADATEGTAISFPVALDVASSEDITLTFSFTNGTAGDADYTNTDIQITIPAGDTTASVVVPTTDDTIFESDEDFTISIASVDAGTVSDSSDTATGTINNDDTAPVITITDADATEGTAISFPVALDVASSEDITLTFSFTNGTAGDADYTNTDIQITIPAGDTTASVVVPTTDDTIFEADEDFTISIASVDAGTVSDTSDTATGTINNDDTAPVITITDADATEGTAISFPVALDVASSEDITLTFSFTNGTAGDADYTNTDIQITIPAGDTTASVVVPTPDDTIFEADEDFTISIASVDAGTVSDTSDTATGTINNDDTAPVITITDADATEGTAITFPVALDVASSEDITLTFSFTNGTAGDGDYTNTDIQITIPAGDTTASVVVPTTDDTIFEADEDFSISIASVDAGTVSDTSNTATGTIIDNDTVIDIDSDNDGIVNSFEDLNLDGDNDPSTNPTDTDMDGIPDYLDIDSDNDGIPDIVEAQTSENYLTPSGNDADNNGLDDSFETSGLFPIDTDLDGIPDYLDEDSDNDGVPDVIEAHDYNHDGVGDFSLVDSDKDADGLDDGFEGDTAIDVDVTNGVTNPNVYYPDTDQDGVIDFRDTDDDDDGIETIDEDYNGDGNYANDDADADGTPDYLDSDRETISTEEVKVINVITPNGDNVHDVLEIRGIENYPVNTLRIFNRWGAEVFSTEGYGSRGNYFEGFANKGNIIQKEARLPVGTYFYVFTYQDAAGETKSMSSYIYLN